MKEVEAILIQEGVYLKNINDSLIELRNGLIGASSRFSEKTYFLIFLKKNIGRLIRLILKIGFGEHPYNIGVKRGIKFKRGYTSATQRHCKNYVDNILVNLNFKKIVEEI